MDGVGEVMVIGCESKEPVWTGAASGNEGGEGSTKGEVEGAGGRGAMADALELPSSGAVFGGAWCCSSEKPWLPSAIAHSRLHRQSAGRRSYDWLLQPRASATGGEWGKSVRGQRESVRVLGRRPDYVCAAHGWTVTWPSDISDEALGSSRATSASGGVNYVPQRAKGSVTNLASRLD